MENSLESKSSPLVNALIVAGIAVLVVFFWSMVKSTVMFVVTLGILVFIHEWGHFIAAKAVGVHVYEFALGFGPKLCTYMRRGGTEYTIRLLPIGGFVNPKGMQPEDPITSDGINGRRPAERALVYLAGPLMNVVLCVVVLCLRGVVSGSPDPHTVLVSQITKSSEASRMTMVSRDGAPVTDGPHGLRVGDHILAVNGKPAERMEVVTTEIHESQGKPVVLEVERDHQKLELRGVPVPKPMNLKLLVVTSVQPGGTLDIKADDQLESVNGTSLAGEEHPRERALQLLAEAHGQPVEVKLWRGGNTPLRVSGVAPKLDLEIKTASRTVGILGFQPVPGAGPPVSLGKSVEMGMTEVVGIFQGMVSIFSQPKEIISGDNVGGPVTIFKVLNEVGKLPAFYYFSVLASLSMSLAFFNLLPIPVLDGGHMLLLVWEVLRRRRLEPETQRTVQYVGLAIILVIFFWITTKDIHGLHG